MILVNKTDKVFRISKEFSRNVRIFPCKAKELSIKKNDNTGFSQYKTFLVVIDCDWDD